MHVFIKRLLLSLLVIPFLLSSAMPAYAAMFRADESIYFAENETGLKDLYTFGKNITIDAPVTNDLVAAGGNVTVNGDITGSLMVAGGDVVIRSTVGNHIRAAGGNIIMSGIAKRDLLLAGGDVRVTRDASVSGDLVFAGGKLQLDAPVKGKVIVNGGDIVINSTITGDVMGTVGSLTLGKNAVINGKLSYTSREKAQIQKGAKVAQAPVFKQAEAPKEEQKGVASAFTGAALYKLIIDIVLSLLLVTMLPLFVMQVIDRVNQSKAGAAGIGFLVLVFMPLFCLFLFFLVWLGIAGLLLYGLLLILSNFLAKLLVGWWIMRWWEKREKRTYELDWKAAVVGPVACFVLMLIPIAGWIIGFIIYLMAFGGLAKTVYAIAATQRSKTK